MNQNNQQEQKYAFHVEDDGTIFPRALVRSSAVSEIPPGVYTLVFEELPGRPPKIFLRPENTFKLPERLYGNIKVEVDRFLRSYELNDKNLGILLIGVRGSGKTLTLKALAIKAIELDFAVINVNTKIPADILTWFLSTITQPTIVNIDEYEKMYSGEKDQKGILGLLDGVDTGSKKIYCLTANDEDGISAHMFDRPTRVRYIRRFKRLEVPTVVDYVQTNLKGCTEEHIRAFIHLALSDAEKSNGMNFDSMAEYVREINQFGGDLNDTLEMMATQGTRTWSYFEVTGFKEGEKKYRASATGVHQGAYVGRDDWKIKFSIYDECLKAKETPEEEDIMELHVTNVTLTNDDFKGFGDTHDMLVFEQAGMEFHLRYMDHVSGMKITDEINQENGRLGKSQRVRPGAWSRTQQAEGFVERYRANLLTGHSPQNSLSPEPGSSEVRTMASELAQHVVHTSDARPRGFSFNYSSSDKTGNQNPT